MVVPSHEPAQATWRNVRYSLTSTSSVRSSYSYVDSFDSS
jgi:hypothetical protein